MAKIKVIPPKPAKVVEDKVKIELTRAEAIGLRNLVRSGTVMKTVQDLGLGSLSESLREVLGPDLSTTEMFDGFARLREP